MPDATLTRATYAAIDRTTRDLETALATATTHPERLRLRRLAARHGDYLATVIREIEDENRDLLHEIDRQREEFPPLAAIPVGTQLPIHPPSVPLAHRLIGPPPPRLAAAMDEMRDGPIRDQHIPGRCERNP